MAARNAYPRLLREGDEYRMLLSLALLNALRGRLDVAARIVGFDDAVGARIGENVNVLASLFHERLDPLLAAGCRPTSARVSPRKARRCATTRRSSWRSAIRRSVHGTSGDGRAAAPVTSRVRRCTVTKRLLSSGGHGRLGSTAAISNPDPCKLAILG